MIHDDTIPRIAPPPGPPAPVPDLLAALERAGFEGDMSVMAADRTVFATDNSIYQVPPQAVLFPRGLPDLVRIARALAEPEFHGVAIRPRGGGTGTNGQSLGEGVVVDVSRHTNRVLEIDAAAGWVRVEAGVVKDQLNAALLPHGMFFAPELSTSNRATIGGMVSTDACGQGSCLYGKTRDHVLSLRSVLLDGTVWDSEPLDDAALDAVKRRPDRVGEVHRVVDRVQVEKAALIAERFPRLNRCLTGYDLAHIRDGQGRFDLNAVLCGSEGTLALVAEATLRILPIPAISILVNLRYDSFDAALRDAPVLAGFRPSSIETVDSMVLGLAQGAPAWDGVAAFFPDGPDGPPRGVNLVEFTGSDVATVEAEAARLVSTLEAASFVAGRAGHTIARGKAVDRIWGMRKRAVGLLGNKQGNRRPVPFVEDAVVPPENLADFIAGFRALLDRRGLEYGMVGHVDAGVLHVRPALDLKDPAQEVLVREITEEVVALTRRYGGLLWGEHGKGVRSEFVPEVFGPLFPCLVEIKRAFDGRDQVNPGKIASALGEPLLRVDGVPLRGAADRTIPPSVRERFDEALHCNGNGACFNFDHDDAMCPSWRATRLRRHSPKGRSALLREWLRLLAAQGAAPGGGRRGLPGLWRRVRNTLEARRGSPDFSHEVREAMDGCLACKSCKGDCPIKVDVPSFRAKFLHAYYGRYLRPLRHFVVAGMERLLPVAAKAPTLHNWLLGSGPASWALRRIGLVDTPLLTGIDLGTALRGRGVGWATRDALLRLPEAERSLAVVLVQDAFTSFLDTGVLLDVVDLVVRLGHVPFVAPYRPNGKPLHVHGFLRGFHKAASSQAGHLAGLAATGVALVGIDPSIALTYRDEYPATLGPAACPEVMLLQEWLMRALPDAPRAGGGQEVLVLLHCTERTTAGAASRSWADVLSRAGLVPRLPAAGCCGMAGTFGHEAEHRDQSALIYGQSWARHVRNVGCAVAATGYSCRSQILRLDGKAVQHPARVLLDHLVTAA